MSNIKSTKGMCVKKLKEYYKNNPTLMGRIHKAEECMKKHGMTYEQINNYVPRWFMITKKCSIYSA